MYKIIIKDNSESADFWYRGYIIKINRTQN